MRPGEPVKETAPLSEIREAQLEGLRTQLQYVRDSSEFYADRLESVDIDSVNSLQALGAVPLLTKDDLRSELARALPLGGHACANYEDVIQVQSSSGTTGRPTYVGLTEDDHEAWRETVARVFDTNGFQAGESYIHGYGLSKGFVGGVPILQGLQELGVSALPVGAESGVERILHIVDDLGPENLVATPSFARYLGRQANELLGKPASDLSIERVSCGGEPGLEAIRDDIEDIWGADVYQVMGATEVAPAYFAECKHQNLHPVRPQYHLLELIDPDSLDPLPFEEGETGELVATTLYREASPVVRYRLGDVVTVTETVCPCGRSMPALTCHGRTDDMLIVRGVNVFPSAVADVLSDFGPELTGRFRIVKRFEGHSTDQPLLLEVEHADRAGDDGLGPEVKAVLASQLALSATVEMVPAGSLERPAEDEKISYIHEPDE